MASAGLKKSLRSLATKLPFYLTRNLQYDAETIKVMKKVLKPGSNCVDVGCHEGEILSIMLKYAPNGMHYAFEPLPHLYEKVRMSFPANCKFFKLGLSDVKGQSSFNYVISNPAYSGLKKRSYNKKDEKDTLITIETDLLDNIIPSTINIDLIKIDVEGGELQVLKGAVNTIKRSKPVIIFEHGLGAADHYGTKPEDVYRLLNEECGLKLSLMERWLKNEKPLSAAEFSEQFYNSKNYYFIAY